MVGGGGEFSTRYLILPEFFPFLAFLVSLVLRLHRYIIVRCSVNTDFLDGLVDGWVDDCVLFHLTTLCVHALCRPLIWLIKKKKMLVKLPYHLL